jgi:hypothetical protein
MSANGARRSIGTERESALHRALKLRYAGPAGAVEVAAAGYVCDAVTGQGEIIEVQTGSFGPLKAKIAALAAGGPVRVVHPIPVLRQIELYDRDGALLHRRRSPRRGSPWDLFAALVYAPALALLPNVRIELAMIEIVEQRVQDGRGSWRRRGVSVREKVLAATRESIVLQSSRDYDRFLPFPPEKAFTVRELAETASIRVALAGKAVYVLTAMNLLARTGKQGNAWLYTRVSHPA